MRNERAEVGPFSPDQGNGRPGAGDRPIRAQAMGNEPGCVRLSQPVLLTRRVPICRRRTPW